MQGLCNVFSNFVVVLKMAVWLNLKMAIFISRFYFLDNCEWDCFPYVFFSVFVMVWRKAINILGVNFVSCHFIEHVYQFLQFH